MRLPAQRRRRSGWHRHEWPQAWGVKADYIPHHEPFEYYASTANPHHVAPTSLQAVGHDTQTYTNGKPNFDTANHQYDMSTFDKLVSGIAAGQLSPNLLPAVSFLKAAGYQDGHAAYSDPIDEQQFIVNEINALEKTPDWSSTAVVIAYDDSDGWYDHAFSGITNPSQSPADALTGTGACGSGQPLARSDGPVRLRPAAAAARHLPVGPRQLRRTAPARTRPRSSASSKATGVWARSRGRSIPCRAA